MTASAHDYMLLQLPDRELLPSAKVFHLIQDSEGALWYATAGGGLCRDDGRHVDIFRNDAEQPELLGSNKVACLAEAGQHILIGTYHGASCLDKRDYSIRRLDEVDDYRVDDIMVARDGRIFLTSNRKIYEFSADVQLRATYPSRWNGRDAYVSRLYEGRDGRIWITQWDGGLQVLDNGQCTECHWPIVTPLSDVVQDPTSADLWISTLWHGIVRYNPVQGTVTPQQAATGRAFHDLQLTADGKRLWAATDDGLSLFALGDTLTALPTDSFMPRGNLILHRLSLDHQGRLLVASSDPGAMVVADAPCQPWFNDTVADGPVRWVVRERQGLIRRDGDGERTVDIGRNLTTAFTRRHDGGIWITDGSWLIACTVDGVTPLCPLPARPEAMADDGRGTLWFSSGRDVQRLSLDSLKVDTVVSLANVSQLATTADGVLWMGTIYGKIYRHTNGTTTLDDYASDPDGDPIMWLANEEDRLIIGSNRTTRIYDTRRHTLRQQSRTTSADTYAIELEETLPGQWWSRPGRVTTEHWPKSWPTLLICGLLLCGLLLLFAYYRITLRQQRNRFLRQIQNISAASPAVDANAIGHEETFMQKAVALVEAHLADDSYSVELLGQDLCMSRMTLYRKIQQHTGQKPTQFIRTIRLRHAARLLSESRMSVSEICYATGFSSVSYFSRCFRSVYGVPPTQYGH